MLSQLIPPSILSNLLFSDIVDYLRAMHSQNIRVKAPPTPSKTQNPPQTENQAVDINKLNITHMFVPVGEGWYIIYFFFINKGSRILKYHNMKLKRQFENTENDKSLALCRKGVSE